MREAYHSRRTPSKGTTEDAELVITVVAGRELPSADPDGFSDPFVKLYMTDYTADGRQLTKFGQTETVRGTLRPEWGETFKLSTAATLLEDNAFFTVEVFDRDRLSKDDFLGSCRVFVAHPGDTAALDQWHGLVNHGQHLHKSHHHRRSGYVRIRQQWIGVNTKNTHIADTGPFNGFNCLPEVCPPTMPLFRPLYGRIRLPTNIISDATSKCQSSSSSTPEQPSIIEHVPPVSELVLAAVECVSLGGQCSKNTGTLYLTDFRLVFIPYKASPSWVSSENISSGTLPHLSVPLGCISRIRLKSKQLPASYEPMFGQNRKKTLNNDEATSNIKKNDIKGTPNIGHPKIKLNGLPQANSPMPVGGAAKSSRLSRKRQAIRPSQLVVACRDSRKIRFVVLRSNTRDYLANTDENLTILSTNAKTSKQTNLNSTCTPDLSLVSKRLQYDAVIGSPLRESPGSRSRLVGTPLSIHLSRARMNIKANPAIARIRHGSFSRSRSVGSPSSNSNISNNHNNNNNNVESRTEPRRRSRRKTIGTSKDRDIHQQNLTISQQQSNNTLGINYSYSPAPHNEFAARLAALYRLIDEVNWLRAERSWSHRVAVQAHTLTEPLLSRGSCHSAANITARGACVVGAASTPASSATGIRKTPSVMDTTIKVRRRSTGCEQVAQVNIKGLSTEFTTSPEKGGYYPGMSVTDALSNLNKSSRSARAASDALSVASVREDDAGGSFACGSPASPWHIVNTSNNENNTDISIVSEGVSFISPESNRLENSISSSTNRFIQKEQANKQSNTGKLGQRLSRDYRRIGLHGNPKWVVTDINNDYSICPTYPSQLAFPRSFVKSNLRAAAVERAKRRLPALTWLHPTNGAPLCRCSQPLAGVIGRKLIYDTLLLQAIRSTVAKKTPEQVAEISLHAGSGVGGNRNVSTSLEPCETLHIFDARSRLAAQANAVAGRGYEAINLLGGKQVAQVHFLDIDNIHVHFIITVPFVVQRKFRT